MGVCPSCGAACRAVEMDGMPAAVECSAYIGGEVVAYHEMMRWLEVGGTFHGVAIDTGVGFVDTDVIAKHEQVYFRSQPGVCEFGMLHGGESVAQHTYIIVTFPEIVEKPDGTRDEGLLLCEAFEIDGVEFPTEFHKFFVGACPPFVER